MTMTCFQVHCIGLGLALHQTGIAHLLQAARRYYAGADGVAAWRDLEAQTKGTRRQGRSSKQASQFSGSSGCR